MLQAVLEITNLLGAGAVLAAVALMPLLFIGIALEEQWRSLSRALGQERVPAARKRALAGAWSLRNRLGRRLFGSREQLRLMVARQRQG